MGKPLPPARLADMVAAALRDVEFRATYEVEGSDAAAQMIVDALVAAGVRFTRETPDEPAAPQVRVGQIWADNDPRIEHGMGQRRLLRIIAVGEPDADKVRVVSWYAPLDSDSPATPERPSTIRLSRFAPTSTGYRLIQDAPTT